MIANNLIIILYFLLVVYNGLDIYQTWLLFDNLKDEWNPILRYLIANLGFFPAVIGFKTIWLGFLGIAVIQDKTQKKQIIGGKGNVR